MEKEWSVVDTRWAALSEETNSLKIRVASLQEIGRQLFFKKIMYFLASVKEPVGEQQYQQECMSAV